MPLGANADIAGDSSADPASPALFDLDFTHSHGAHADDFEVVALRTRRVPASNGVVLVVDADARAGERTADLLRAEGWHAVVQANPRDAARNMSRFGTPALMLLEAELPQMSGFEFLQTLRANRNVKDTPVVILAARATRTDLVRALEAGADGYISKSVGDERLARALRRVLGGACDQG
jgi:two-component system alkaline phosphatase synthesis response regulator PhoP